MSAEDVQTEILDPMQRLFLPPRKMEDSEVSAALREYARSLQNFEAPDLRAAWEAVISTHANRSWPVPAAFIVAARSARADRLRPKKAEGEFIKIENPGWEMWLKVRGSDLAREAARRGVAWALKCAIVDDKRRPEEIDLRTFAIQRASAEKIAHRLESGDLKLSYEQRRTALDMWRNLLVHNAETLAEIQRAV